MSDKHFFPETAANTLVPRYLRALTAATPHLSLIESERVVYCKNNDPTTVSVISGGGSGHEPGWSGFVGKGALSAVACGDIFASPSTKQVLAAMRAAPSDEGTILMITNYTGDKLHFGLAAERARAAGFCKNVAVIPLTDDVSLGRSKSAVVGRRGMPGHVIPMKIVGAAASKQHSFQRCVAIAKAVNAQVVSIGSALDHCHVPGRVKHETLPEDVVVVGAGIHNEPGAQRLSPFPPVEELIAYCLKLLCDPSDSERAFVNFNTDDEVVLLLNNYGGLSNLELGALTDETIIQLKRTWSIQPVRILSDAFETSLNGPGFSISLCNLSNAAKESSTTVPELLELFDLRTSAVAWPNIAIPVEQGIHHSNNDALAAEDGPTFSEDSDIKVDPILLDSVVRTACLAAIAAEPDLTKWDMIMGDGDCGEAVQGVSEDILKNLDEGIAKQGSLLKFLFSTTNAVDDMGGSLGAILGILLSAFTSSLQDAVKGNSADSSTYAQALAQAVATLKNYTGAREGDRTVMDVLIPFSDAFAETNDFHASVQVAREKADATRLLKAKFGRASYVAEAQGQVVPDPGAWALYEWLAGMSKAFKQQELL